MPRSRSSSSSSSDSDRGRSKKRRSRSHHKSSSSHKRKHSGDKRNHTDKPPLFKDIPEIMRQKDDDTLKKRIFVGQIRNEYVNEQDLRQIFVVHGKVVGVNITNNGYGFVQFESEEIAQRAAQAEHGNMLKGKKMVVCMALDNRKGDGMGRGRGDFRDRSPVRGGGRGGFRGGPPMGMMRGRGPPGPRPPFGPMDDMPPHMRDYPMRGMPPMRDPFLDELAARDLAARERALNIRERELQLAAADPLARPRDPFYDDPYRRLPPDPYYDRMDDRRPLPDPYRREVLPPPPKPVPAKPPTECQIILMSPPLRPYGEAVERRIKNIGIFTEVITLPPERTLQDAIDDVTSQSFLFAIVISQQNELHRSLTLNILHGKPQVHRNMPLEDCVTLVEKSFEKYLTKKKEAETTENNTASSFDPPDRDTSYLLSLLADSRALTVEELDKVIKYLCDRRAKTGGAAKVEGPKEEVSVVKQREELQAKINNLFSTNKPAAPKTSVTSLVNFDNPNVQKALDTLIQNPGALQGLGSGGSNPTGPVNSPPSRNPINPAGQLAQQAQMFAAAERGAQLARQPVSMRFSRPF